MGNVFSIPWTNNIEGRPRSAFMKESFPAIEDKMKKEIEIYRTLHKGHSFRINPISAEFYDCIEDGSTFYMITEFINESLTRFDENGVETKLYTSFSKFAPKTRLDIYRQIVDAMLTFTKNTKYVYYDVTPSHVRLIPKKNSFSVRLIDFSNAEKEEFTGELSDNPVSNDLTRSLHNFYTNTINDMIFDENLDNVKAAVWSFVSFLYSMETKAPANVLVIGSQYLKEIDIITDYHRYYGTIKDDEWMKDRGLDICSSDKSVCFKSLINEMVYDRYFLNIDLRKVSEELKILVAAASTPLPNSAINEEKTLTEQVPSEDEFESDDEENDEEEVVKEGDEKERNDGINNYQHNTRTSRKEKKEQKQKEKQAQRKLI
jgi:hypothetical protein